MLTNLFAQLVPSGRLGANGQTELKPVKYALRKNLYN